MTLPFQCLSNGRTWFPVLWAIAFAAPPLQSRRTGPAAETAGDAARLLPDAGRHGDRRGRQPGRRLPELRRSAAARLPDPDRSPAAGHASGSTCRRWPRPAGPVRWASPSGPDGDLYVCDNQNWPTGNGQRGRTQSRPAAAAADPRRPDRKHDGRGPSHQPSQRRPRPRRPRLHHGQPAAQDQTRRTACWSAPSIASAWTTRHIARDQYAGRQEPAGHASSRRTATASTAPTAWRSTAGATCSSATSATGPCTRSRSTPQGRVTGNTVFAKTDFATPMSRPDFAAEDGPGQDADHRRDLHRRRRTISTWPISRTTPSAASIRRDGSRSWPRAPTATAATAGWTSPASRSCGTASWSSPASTWSPGRTR